MTHLPSVGAKINHIQHLAEYCCCSYRIHGNIQKDGSLFMYKYIHSSIGHMAEHFPFLQLTCKKLNCEMIVPV